MAVKKLLQALAVLSAGFILFAASTSLQAQTSSNTSSATKDTKPLDVAFMYVSPLLPVGWTAQHDAGRRQMEQALKGRVTTRYVENVPESADAERVLRELAQSGAKLIFAPSFGYGQAVQRVAKDFPEVHFEHVTGTQSGDNIGIANARYYEGRYLAGMLAGGSTKSDLIGYVAAFPIPEVLQGINAFTRGAREVNPNAKVQVVWTNSWFDPPKETDAAHALIAKGADVLTYHLGSTAVPRVAEAKGVKLLGYQSDMRSVAPKAQLASVTHHWGGYYTKVTEAVLQNRWKDSGLNGTWGGLRSGMVKLEFISDEVSSQLQKRIEVRRRQLFEGQHHAFAAPVIDAQGKAIISKGQLSDEQLLKMDYFVEGVIGSLEKK